MLTQDDTFERLRRIPFDQMRTMVAKFYIDNNGTRISIEAMMKSHGWSVEKYNVEWNRLNDLIGKSLGR